MTFKRNGIEYDWNSYDEMPIKWKTTWHEENNGWFDTLFAVGMPILIMSSIVLISLMVN